MSIAFNESGIVTRGMGPNHKLCTRGMSVRFDFGEIGPAFRRELKEYDLNIFTPILRENSEEIEIYSPLEIRRDGEISINSSIYKEMGGDMNILAKLNYDLLSRILDAI